MSILANLWSTFFGWLPAWFAAFLIAAIGLIALVLLFKIIALIWNSIPFL